MSVNMTLMSSISTRTREIYTQSVIPTRTSVIWTHECDYDTHECDSNTQELYFYTLHVILKLMNQI
jgi:hypothetical protein